MAKVRYGRKLTFKRGSQFCTDTRKATSVPFFSLSGYWSSLEVYFVMFFLYDFFFCLFTSLKHSHRDFNRKILYPWNHHKMPWTLFPSFIEQHARHHLSSQPSIYNKKKKQTLHQPPTLIAHPLSEITAFTQFSFGYYVHIRMCNMLKTLVTMLLYPHFSTQLEKKAGHIKRQRVHSFLELCP